MKKILAFIICIVLVCAMPLVAFAEGEDSSVDTTEITGENLIEDLKEVLIILAESPTKGEAIDKLMAMNPNATAGDIIDLVDGFEQMSIFWDCRECVFYDLEEGLDYGLEAAWVEWYIDTYFPELPESCESDTGITKPTPESEPTPEPEPTPEEQAKVTTEKIVAWIMERLDTISCVITIILTTFYQIRKHAVLNKSIGTLNNNSIVVAKNSETAITNALVEVQSMASVVKGYKEEMAKLLKEVKANEEEKQKLEQTLTEVHTHLKSAKLANVELANEVADLLVLANIPNSKKEELYSRHLAAVGAIADADKTEVKENA